MECFDHLQLTVYLGSMEHLPVFRLEWPTLALAVKRNIH